MERDETVLYFGQNMATTREPYVDAFGKDRVRVTPISETAEIGMAVGAAWPATGRWSSCTWPSSCSSRWTRWSTRRHGSRR